MVPPVSVGWEFTVPVVEREPEVVISLLRVVVFCVEVVGVVMGAVVFLLLPQAKSAHTRTSAKNIARIFFISFSLILIAKVKL